MRRKSLLIFVLSALMGSLYLTDLVVADPLEDGVAVYQNQDYDSALRLLEPLAEQGDAAR